MKSIWILLLPFLAIGVYVLYSMDRGEPENWLDDFEVLKQGLSSAYANLEWAAVHNKIDLYQVGRKTEEELGKTSSRRKARKIIKKFLQTFNDPHLKAEATSPPVANRQTAEESQKLTTAFSAKDAVKFMGFRKGKSNFKLRFSSTAGFEEFDKGSNPFPAGIVPLPDNRRLGILRIEYFGEDRYYDVAKEAWDQFKAEIDESCDSGCQYAFTQRVGNRLLDFLEERIRQLEGVGINGLVVDVTGNGGGSEWSEAVARFFTSKKLRCAGGSFIKHPHSVRTLERKLSWVEQDLARTDLLPRTREILREGYERLTSLLEQARAGCDLSILWESPEAQPDCSLLIEQPYGCGVFEYLENEEIAQLKSKYALSSFSYFPFREGAYSGPLFVAVDGGTASASEGFATLLQYNDAAVIVGERTYGAGCGYTYGGVHTYLEHTGLLVRMPDCVRFRADGENELAGIEPDISPWEEGDNDKERAQKLVRAISKLSF
ncbi:MAG: S41 family peptidase [bacterium]